MIFDRLAAWIRSLRGEQAEAAARQVAKPIGMSRRAFLGALGLTTTSLIFGEMSVELPKDFSSSTNFAPLGQQTMREYLKEWERVRTAGLLLKPGTHRNSLPQVTIDWKVSYDALVPKVLANMEVITS